MDYCKAIKNRVPQMVEALNKGDIDTTHKMINPWHAEMELSWHLINMLGEASEAVAPHWQEPIAEVIYQFKENLLRVESLVKQELCEIEKRQKMYENIKPTFRRLEAYGRDAAWDINDKKEVVKNLRVLIHYIKEHVDGMLYTASALMNWVEIMDKQLA